ncbi:unnamed protein product [Mesocestoides corti]|uniref:Si:ch211-131k2.2 n=1 Tax=Mesocestoides corti TaxID=53468 RepID=A0A0R3UBY4_MESCO|nr:unnamed protein product [Mesocestoides corti]
MLASLLLLSCLFHQSLPLRIDRSPQQTPEVSDDEYDVAERDRQFLKWMNRHTPQPAVYLPNADVDEVEDDAVATYLARLRKLRAAQKRFKPKMPIYLGLIGKR